jgi:rhodanese-related sulfurtransferase
MLHLLLVAAVCGLVANSVLPNRIPWVEDWSYHIEAKALEEGLTLVDLAGAQRFVQEAAGLVFDARPEEDYDAGHLPGAFSIPEDSTEEKILQYEEIMAPEDPILTYCSGQVCDESFVLTVFLRDRGYTNVVLFVGGFQAWQEAGYDVEGGGP